MPPKRKRDPSDEECSLQSDAPNESSSSEYAQSTVAAKTVKSPQVIIFKTRTKESNGDTTFSRPQIENPLNNQSHLSSMSTMRKEELMEIKNDEINNLEQALAAKTKSLQEQTQSGQNKEKQIRKLENMIKEFKNDTVNLSENANDVQATYEQKMKKMGQEIDNNMEKQITKIQSLEHELKNAKERAKSLLIQARESKSLTETLTAEKAKIENDAKILTKCRTKQQEELKKLRRSVKKAQESVFRMQEPAGWQSEQDSDISHQLITLEKAVKVWAKNYTNKQFENLWDHQLSGEEKSRAKNEWIRLKITFDADELVNALKRSSLVKSGLPMLLAAWATKFLYDKIFKVPFSCLDDVIQKIQPCDNKASFSESMETMLSKMIKGEFENLCKLWLSQNQWHNPVLTRSNYRV
jgi:DNA repair exonuclease SbcCD ATPase subunit